MSSLETKTWIRMSHHRNHTALHRIASHREFTMKSQNPLKGGSIRCVYKSIRHLISFRYRFPIRMRERFGSLMLCALCVLHSELFWFESSFFFGCSHSFDIFSLFFLSLLSRSTTVLSFSCRGANVKL